jgi:hypothetical protein
VSFLSQSTCFVTWVDPDFFDGIASFHRNKHYFVAYDKLFLEQSLGTQFYQFRFPRLRSIVCNHEKNLSRFYVQKAKFSWFYICHDVYIGSPRCHGHHGSLTSWLCDVIDTNFIWALYPNCDVPFLSQPTRFVTRVNLDIFDGIPWFCPNKCCFVAYDKLFLEKSLRTHFCQL